MAAFELEGSGDGAVKKQQPAICSRTCCEKLHPESLVTLFETENN